MRLILFLIALAQVLGQANYFEIYIDNNAPEQGQNGSRLNPYTSFSNAYSGVFSLQYTTPLKFIFNYSPTPYYFLLDLTLELRDTINFYFTSNISNNYDFSSTYCSNLPQIILNSTNVLSQGNFTMIFQNLNFTTYDDGMNINSIENIYFVVNRTCWNFYGNADAIFTLRLNDKTNLSIIDSEFSVYTPIKYFIYLTIEMNNVNINLHNVIAKLNVSSNDTDPVHIFCLDSNNFGVFGNYIFNQINFTSLAKNPPKVYVFKLTYVTTITVSNFHIPQISAGYITVFYLYNTQNVTINNVSVTSSTDLFSFVNHTGDNSSIWLSNVNINNVQNLSLFNSSVSINTLEISNISLIGCTSSDQYPLINLNYLNLTYKMMRQLYFTNISISTSTLYSSLIYANVADENNNPVYYYIPSYTLEIKNLSFSRGDIYTKSWMIISNSVNIALLDSSFFHSGASCGFYHGEMPAANFIINNTNFTDFIFNTENSIFDQESAGELFDPDSEDNFEIYRIFYAENLLITNSIIGNGEAKLFKIQVPFFVLKNSIFNKLDFYSDEQSVIDIKGFTDQYYTQFNMVSKTLADSVMPNFHFNLDYLCEISGNIFQDFTFENYFVKYLLAYSNYVPIIFENNLINNFQASNLLNITEPLLLTSISNNIFINIGLNYLLYFTGNYINFINNTLIMINAVEISYFRGFAVSLTHNSSIYLLSYATTSLDAVSPLYLNVTVSESTFLFNWVRQGLYTPNQVIVLKAGGSLELNQCNLINIQILYCSLYNDFSQPGYYPAIINSFIDVEMLGVQTIKFIGILLQNLYTAGFLNALFILKSGTIVVTNLTVINPHVIETVGPACIIEANTAIMNNININNFAGFITSCSIYANLASFMTIQYSEMGMSYVIFSNLNFERWPSNLNSAISIISSNTTISISGTYFENVGSCFSVSSQSASLHIINNRFNGTGRFLETNAEINSTGTLSIVGYTQFSTTSGLLLAQFLVAWNVSSILLKNIQITNPALVSTYFISVKAEIMDLIISNPYDAHEDVFMTTGIRDNTVFIIKNCTFINFKTFGSFLSVNAASYTTTQYPSLILDVENILLANCSLEPLFDFYTLNITANITGLIVFNSQIEIIQYEARVNGLISGSLTLANSIFYLADIKLYIFNPQSNLSFRNLIVFKGIPDGDPDPDQLDKMNKNVSLSGILYVNMPNHIIFEKANVSIMDSVFANNVNTGLGSCLSFIKSSFYLSNSIFTGNRAPAGGVIFEIEPIDSDLNMLNVTEFNNNASLYGDFLAGGPSYSFVNLSTPSMSIFSQYMDYSYTQTIVNGDLNVKIYNASLIMLNYLTIEITVYDIRNQTLYYDSASNLRIKVKSPYQASKTISMDTTKGKISTIKVPGNLFHLQGKIQSNQYTIYINFETFEIQILIDMILRNCLPGEFLDPATELCVLCTNNTYSLVNGSSCASCPVNAYCEGGDILNVDKGFWRLGYTSSIYNCLDDGISRCQGGTNPDSQCLTGYSGALCLGCNATLGYSPSLGDICDLCSEDHVWIMIKGFGMLLFNYAYEIVYIWFINRSNKKFTLFMQGDKNKLKREKTVNSYYLGIEIFIFTNYLQFAYIIVNYMSYLQSNLMIIINQLQLFLTLSANPSSEYSSNFNCLLLLFGANPSQITYTMIVVVILLPFAKVALALLFIFIQYKRKKLKRTKNVLYVTLISFFFLEQSSLVQTLSKYGICIIFEVVGYSVLDPNISCSDPGYLKFKEELVYPSLFFWGVLLPSILGIVLYVYRHRTDEVMVRRKIGSLINNFKSEKYYWILLLVLTKLGLIFVLTVISIPRNATIIGVMIVGVYYYMASLVNPFPDSSLLSMDRIGGLTLTLSLILFNQSIENEDEVFSLIYVIMIFGSMFSAACYMIYRIVKRLLNIKRIGKQLKIEQNIRDSTDDDGLSPQLEPLKSKDEMNIVSDQSNNLMVN